MNVSVINVTPKRAVELFGLRWEKQRKVNSRHVSFLSSEIKKGRFEPSTIELVKNLTTGEIVMIDGQHALKAIAISGKVQPMILKEKTVASEHGVALAFSRIDVHRKRNLGDSLGAFNLAAEVPYKRWFIKKVASAIKFIEHDFGIKRTREVAIEDSIKGLLEWKDFAHEYIMVYDEAIGGRREKQRYANRSILSIGLVTFRYVENTDMVREFWRGFIDGSNLSKYDPRLIGRNKFLSVSLKGGAITTAQEMWSPNLISRLVAWSWNAYYLGESRTRVSMRNKGKILPIELKGTKYYTGR